MTDPIMQAKPERVIGVLGGLGPEATVDFMQKLLKHSHAKVDQDHPHVIIDCNPKVPDRNRAIAGTGEPAAPALAEMARALERAGADFLVMVCSTAHAFAPDVAAATALPFVSIIEETCAEVVRQVGTPARIGLLAAEGCYNAGVFDPVCAAHGLSYVHLEPAERQGLMQCIYRIKAGEHGAAVSAEVERLSQALIDRGADAIVASCTEIPLVFTGGALRKPFIDSVDVLARRALLYARNQAALPPRK